MKRGLLWLNRLAILIMALIVASGSLQLYSDYSAYGLSYRVTTIIAGVESTRTVSVYANILSLMIVMGVTLVLLVDSSMLVLAEAELKRRVCQQETGEGRSSSIETF